jgi:hypothetical protein
MQITADSLLPKFRERGLALYSIHDVDDVKGVYPKYWGSAHDSGAYTILKQVSAEEYRYFAGRNSYTTAWAARALLDYDYLFNIDLDS